MKLGDAISRAAEKVSESAKKAVAETAPKPETNSAGPVEAEVSFAEEPPSLGQRDSTEAIFVRRPVERDESAPVPLGNQTAPRPSGSRSGAWQAAQNAVESADAEVTVEGESEEPADNRNEFERHAETLDTYFDVFDNPGDGDTDGRTSGDDIEEIASGDYDQDAARDRLREAGVAEGDIDGVLSEIEDTADYLNENEEARDRIDGGADNGNTDNRISREDLDQVLAETRSERHADLEDEQAVELLENHFDVFDNPGGGGTDGKISDEDLERIAEGDYDRDAARQRLREAGVSEADLNNTLGELESTARHLREDEEGLYRDLDIANDDSNDVDGDIRRGDLDRYLLDNRPEPDTESLRPSEQDLQEAQEAYTFLTENPEALEELLEEERLSDLSQGELLALAQLGQDDPEAGALLSDAVLESVEEAESLDDLPQGLGYQTLLSDNLTNVDPEQLDDEQLAAQEHLGGLVQDHLDNRLDELLDDRRGDSEADLSIDRFVADLEDFAAANPALSAELATRAEESLAGAGDRITDVRRADDSRLSRIGHAFTDGVNGVAGFVGDRIRDIGEIGGQVLTAPLRAYGDVADFALTQGGRLAGGALDAVGADGAADFVRDTSAAAGDFADDATDFVADQQQNFINGFAEGAAGGVEGIAATVTDPIGTARGLAQIVRDPSLLLENYRQVLDEHGWAGLAGNLTFDVLSTVATGGGGGASVGSRLTRVAGALDDFGRTGSTLGRVTSGGARALGRFEQGAARVSSSLGNAADSVVGRLGRRVDLPEGFRSQVGSLDDALHNAGLLDELAEGAGRSNPASLLDGIDGGEIIAGNRVEALNFLSEQFPDVDPSRLNRWVNGDAALDGELAIIKAPEGTRFSRTFNDAFESRNALQESLGDGLFNGNAAPNGNYYNLAEDVETLSRGQLRRGNAVPIINNSDRFVLKQFTDEGYVLASRVAPQLGADGFGPGTLGGLRQYRILDGDLLETLSEGATRGTSISDYLWTLAVGDQLQPQTDEELAPA